MGWGVLVVSSYFMAVLSPFFFLFSAVLTTKIISDHMNGAHAHLGSQGFWMEQLRWIGILSYSIYLLHQPLLEMWAGFLRHVFPGIQPFPTFLCCALFWFPLMLLAIVWYRFLERPGIALGRWTIKRMAQRHEVIPVAEPTIQVESKSEPGADAAP
ncbi:MAG: hypothetical protein ACREDS_13005 [Limisphaerales bacterium]